MHLEMRLMRDHFNRILKIMCILLIITKINILFLHLFVCTGAEVFGNSMEAALHEGELGIVMYHEKIELGDIIVFKVEIDGKMSNVVKRVIADEGSTIEIKNGIVFVDGKPSEDYAKPGTYTGNYSKRTVPENCYFVLGDNRDVSLDSRFKEIGFVSKDTVLGKFYKTAF